MVIPDYSPGRKASQPESQPQPLSPRAVELARPLDRLAAVIVDVFVLLVPVYILLSAPFKKWLTASFILGSEPEFIGLIACMVVLGIALVILYQGLLHFFLGATLGKLLFDLRIRPIFHEDRVTLSSCFARAAIWLFECVLLGLPFLAVFSNAKRRTLHDRISDSVVVSIAGTGVKAPGLFERGMVRGVFASCLLILLMIGGFQIHGILTRLKAEKGLTSFIDKDSAQCPVVGEYLQHEGRERAPSEHDRLQLAMSLYAAGLADRNCLEAEIEFEVANQIAVGPITYLAQAFVNSDDAEVSNSYLDQVCEEAAASTECAMSRVVSSWSDEDWDSVEKILGAADKGSGYLEVWGVRHFMKAARYDQALLFLDALVEHRELAEFSMVQRVKALYNRFSGPEANAALAQAISALPKEDGENLSAWVCAQQLQGGCSALTALACKDVAQIHELNEIDFTRSSAALSQIMALECSNGKALDYLTFSEAVKDEDWQLFFRANLKRQKDDNAAAFKLFAEVLRSAEAPDLLRVEALRRSSEFATREQLATMVDVWHELESKEIWVKAGNLLFTRYVQKNDRAGALSVAQNLMGAEALAPDGQAVLTRLAAQSERAERKPASVHTKKQRGGE